MSNKRITTFEDLECWKACRQLRLFVAKEVVPVLPKEEKFRLCDQILKATRSTTANIAEGYGRFHYMDKAKFSSNSRGSCWEVLDHLITANDEELIPKKMLDEGRELVNTAVKLLNGYISYLQRAGKQSAVYEESSGYSVSNDSCSNNIYPITDNR